METTLIRPALLALAVALNLAARGDSFMPRQAPVAPAAAKVVVQPGNNMPVVAATLNGRPCTLLFDTGATHTTFDTTFIQKALPAAKLEPVVLAGQTNVEGQPQLLHADTLTIGEATFGDFDAMVLAMPHLSASIGTSIDGVLGMNVIGATRTVLSLGAGEVRFGLPIETRGDFGTPARRNPRDPFRIDLVAEIDGKALPLFVDSAASFTFLERSSGWKSTGEAAPLAAIDINGNSDLQPVRGETGALTLGTPVTIAPLLVPAPLNRIGADTLLRYDLLIEPRAVAFRSYVPAQPPQPQP